MHLREIVCVCLPQCHGVTVPQCRCPCVTLRAVGLDALCCAGDCPVQTLFDFTRLHSMAPGESRVALLTGGGSTAPPACVDSATGDWVVQPGQVTVQVGDVVAPATHTLQVRGPRVTVLSVLLCHHSLAPAPPPPVTEQRQLPLCHSAAVGRRVSLPLFSITVFFSLPSVVVDLVPALHVLPPTPACFVQVTGAPVTVVSNQWARSL